jgi:YebC/PmpR family DNA-binding regulatory protein
MSGHSKWSTIKRQKEANDARRGQLFSKFARAITLAAKQGGANPAANIRLRALIEKARQINMPKENIERAIARGKEAESLEEILYEGYGPDGIPIIVEVATDNKNRTAQEIKNLFERGGGTLAGPGSVAFQFERAGQILVEKKEKKDEQMLQLIDLGVEDVEETTDGIEVYTKPAELFQVKEKIENAGMKVLESDIVFRPKTPVVVSDPNKVAGIVRFLESLDDSDDVQKVYAGFKF